MAFRKTVFELFLLIIYLRHRCVLSKPAEDDEPIENASLKIYSPIDFIGKIFQDCTIHIFHYTNDDQLEAEAVLQANGQSIVVSYADGVLTNSSSPFSKPLDCTTKAVKKNNLLMEEKWDGWHAKTILKTHWIQFCLVHILIAPPENRKALYERSPGFQFNWPLKPAFPCYTGFNENIYSILLMKDMKPILFAELKYSIAIALLPNDDFKPIGLPVTLGMDMGEFGNPKSFNYKKILLGVSEISPSEEILETMLEIINAQLITNYENWESEIISVFERKAFSSVSVAVQLHGNTFGSSASQRSCNNKYLTNLFNKEKVPDTLNLETLELSGMLEGLTNSSFVDLYSKPFCSSGSRFLGQKQMKYRIEKLRFRNGKFTIRSPFQHFSVSGYNAFQFISCVRLPTARKSYDAIWRPFQLNFWVAAFLIFFIAAIFLQYLLKKNSKNENVEPASWMLFVLMMDQGLSKLHFPWILNIVIGSVMITAITITNGYKGIITSYLTVEWKPSLLQNFNQIATFENITIYTPVLGLLDRMEFSSQTVVNSKSIDMVNSLYGSFEFGRVMQLREEMIINGEKILPFPYNMLSKNLRIPQKYPLVSHQEEVGKCNNSVYVDDVGKLENFLKKSKWLKLPKQLLYRGRDTILNSFRGFSFPYSPISKYMRYRYEGLFQSGIIEWWRQVLVGKDNCKECIMETTDAVGINRKQKRLSFENILVIMYLYVVGICICLASFGYETIKMFVKKNKMRLSEASRRRKKPRPTMISIIAVGN